MQELMVRISFPVRRFTSASHHYAWPARGCAPPGFHGRSQVHQECDGTKYALGMIDQADKFAHRGATAQIDHSAQLRMVMADAANLDKLHLAAKMIHHLLVAGGLPPFDGVIVLAA